MGDAVVAESELDRCGNQRIDIRTEISTEISTQGIGDEHVNVLIDVTESGSRH